MSGGLRALGVAGLSRELAAGRLSSVELTQELLAAARADLAAGAAGLGAFLAIDSDAALAQAQAADERRAAGQAGPLCFFLPSSLLQRFLSWESSVVPR